MQCCLETNKITVTRHTSRVTCHVPRMPTVQMVGRMTPSVHQSTRVAMALGSKSRSGSGASELLPRVWFNASLRFLTCSRPWSSHRQLAGPVCSCTWHQPSGNWMLLKVGALKTNFEIKIINVHIISALTMYVRISMSELENPNICALAQETEARQRWTRRAIYKILSEERDRWLIELRKP